MTWYENHFQKLQEARKHVEQASQDLLAYEIEVSEQQLETFIDEIKSIINILDVLLKVNDFSILMLVKIDHCHAVADECRLHLAAAYQARNKISSSATYQLRLQQHAAKKLQQLSSALNDVFRCEQQLRGKEQQPHRINHLHVVEIRSQQEKTSYEE